MGPGLSSWMAIAIGRKIIAVIVNPTNAPRISTSRFNLLSTEGWCTSVKSVIDGYSADVAPEGEFCKDVERWEVVSTVRSQPNNRDCSIGLLLL